MTIEFQVREIPADRLTVDPAVQRAVDPSRVRKIADRWDDKMAGVLTVSHRQELVIAGFDGPDVSEEFVVLDGQTRLAAFRAVCAEATCLPLTCQVYTGLTLKEEAAMFLEHNDRKAVHSRDRFRLANTAGEEWALDVTDIAATFGWAAVGANADGKLKRFSPISTAERIYRLDDGISLKRAFQTISNAWGSQPGAVCTETLSGLGLLFARHPDLDSKQTAGLVTKLKKISLGTFVGDITADRRRHSISSTRASYLYVVSVYNRGRSEDHRI